MLDVFNLPNNLLSPDTDTQTFIGRLQTSSNLTPSLNDVQIWRKPRGIRMVHILCIGGGGGGGGGQSAAAGANKAGGGGGGAAGLATFIIPAFYLPDKLYILPGYGGVGGAAATAGIVGTPSYVLVSLDTNLGAQNTVLTSGTANQVAGAGQPGSGGTGGAAGGGCSGASNSASSAPFIQLGGTTFTGFSGSGGGAGGGTATAGTNASWTSGTAFLMGGSGGGGSNSTTNAAGGGVTLTGFFGPVLEAKPSASVTAAGVPGPGTGGFVVRAPNCPFFAFGGTGASGVDAAVGAAGGNGAPGCGGGGGGSGTTGGAGGNGGPGFIAIVGW